MMIAATGAIIIREERIPNLTKEQLLKTDKNNK